MKWYRQHLADDTLDLDYVYERMLIDLPVNGQTRKAVVTTGKLGIIEAIDRTNGEWLWHKETVPQNVVAAIDPKTGEKTLNPQAMPHAGRTVNCYRSGAAARRPPTIRWHPLAAQRYCAHDAAAIGPGHNRRRPGRFRRTGSQQRRNFGRLTRSAGRQINGLVDAGRAPRTSAVLPTGGGWVHGRQSLLGARRDDRQRVGKSAPTMRSTRFRSPIASTASSTLPWPPARVRGWCDRCLRSPRTQNPDGGSVLWVFALPN
jgi:alcohol dehydrogenase (cytochrome c)